MPSREIFLIIREQDTVRDFEFYYITSGVILKEYLYTNILYNIFRNKLADYKKKKLIKFSEKQLSLKVLLF